MGDFFSGVRGARFPDVVMNSGPLPPAGGLPAPLHDTADAKINYNSTLLGDLQPYAYGEPGYQSSQVSYVNHPHRIQKVVPLLHLPRPQVNAQLTFDISHSVDDSDLAFVMRLDRGSSVCTLLGEKSAFRQRLGTTVDPFINLCTLNYLLAGLQLCHNPGHPSKWHDLLVSLDKERFSDMTDSLEFDDIRHIVRGLITPFGIVRGSEKQGGQDEVGLSPATWPVNFVVNMVIDGKERNVVNLWHYHEVAAGDDLVLRLKPMAIPRREGYTLNHYYKSVVRQDFESAVTGGRMNCSHVWQLVPDIFSLVAGKENCSVHGGLACAHVVMPSARLRVPKDYIWQSFGFWHIGRTQVRFRKYGEAEYYNNDMAQLLKVNHMDMTFQPSWHKCPGEPQFGEGAAKAVRRHAAGVGGGGQPTKVAKGLFGDFDPGRVWAPSLRLERAGFPFAEAPPVPTLAAAAMPDVVMEPGVRKTGLLAAFSETFSQRLTAPADGGIAPSAGIDLLAAAPSSVSDADMQPPGMQAGGRKPQKKKGPPVQT